MKSRHTLHAIILIGAWSPSWSAQPETDSPALTETIGDFLFRYREEYSKPLVDHCMEKVPALKDQLTNEYSAFRARFGEARLFFADKVSGLSDPAPALMMQIFIDGRERARQPFYSLDPKTTCPDLLVNLRSTTVDMIRTDLANSFARLEAMAREIEKENQ